MEPWKLHFFASICVYNVYIFKSRSFQQIGTLLYGYEQYMRVKILNINVKLHYIIRLRYIHKLSCTTESAVVYKILIKTASVFSRVSQVQGLDAYEVPIHLHAVPGDYARSRRSNHDNYRYNIILSFRDGLRIKRHVLCTCKFFGRAYFLNIYY